MAKALDNFKDILSWPGRYDIKIRKLYEALLEIGRGPYMDCRMIVPTDLSGLDPDPSPIEDLTNMGLTGMALAANQYIYCYGVNLPYASREYKGRLTNAGYADGGEAISNEWTQLLLYNTSGAQWVVPQCTLTLTRDGGTLDALIPDLILENGQFFYLWVSETGAVYSGSSSAPDWENPLRLPTGAIVPAATGVYYDPADRFLTQGSSWKLLADVGTVVNGKHGMQAHADRDADGIMIAGFSYNGTPPDQFKVAALIRFCSCDGTESAVKPFTYLNPIVMPGGFIDAAGVVTPPATAQMSFSVTFSIPETLYDENSRMVELQLVRLADDPADTAGEVDNIGIGTYLWYTETLA